MGGNVDLLRPDCGLPINTYFSAVKMRWLLENSEEVKQASTSKDGHLKFGNIDAWLIAKLTGMESLMTDSTNASRTMLMDINSLEWSQKMMDHFDIKEEWLPTISKSSSADFGRIKSGRLANVPIAGVLGDQ
jgi:glycerol kinase